MGIVVGRMDLGETDRVIRILSPELGRVSVVARGARSGRGRFAGADIGVRVRWSARAPADAGGLRPLVSLEVEDPRVRLRASYARIVLAGHACEAVGALARENHAEPRLFGLLETALLLLDATDTDPGSAFRAGIEAKALTFAGIGPALVRCTGCEGALEPEMRFSAAGGGLRHRGCVTTEDGPAIPMTAEFAGALEAARRAPLAALLDAALPAGPEGALSDAIEAHLGRALATRALIDPPPTDAPLDRGGGGESP